MQFVRQNRHHMRGAWIGCFVCALLSYAPGAEPEVPRQPEIPSEAQGTPFDAIEAELPEAAAGEAEAPTEAAGTELLSTARSTANITHRIARTVDDVDSSPPDSGANRVHLIDVGTGLSILIQGHAFNLLFHGGSGDDGRGITAIDNNSRLRQVRIVWGSMPWSGDRV